MTDPRDPDQPYIMPTAIRAAVTGLSDETKFPDATLARFVSRFEDLAEKGPGGKGVAFTPRTTTEDIYSDGRSPLFLLWPRAYELTAIAYDSASITPPEIADVSIRHGWSLELTSGAAWPCGRWVTVTYLHGYPEPPAAVIDACIEFVRAEAMQQKGSQPRNVTGERTDLGWIPEPTADPSKGRPTRWTVVNEALNSVPDERIPGVA